MCGSYFKATTNGILVIRIIVTLIFKATITGI